LNIRRGALKNFSIICIALLLTSCTTAAGSRNVVSPSLSEEEAARHVRTLPTIGTLSSSKEKPAVQRDEHHTEKTSSYGSLINSEHTQKALIKLLEKKGIITAEELSEEIRRLKAE
jgi:hypothetical protein